MKLKLCVHRKAGAPNYGSDGAGAELEIEIDDELAAKPASLVDVARHWYGALETAVAQELDRLQAAHPAPVAVRASAQPEPDRSPDRAREREPRRWNPDDLPPPPDRGSGGPPPSSRGGGGHSKDGPPRDGRQLLAWANRQGLDRRLKRMAKDCDRGMIVDWDPGMVEWAYGELTRSQQTVGSWGGN